MNCISNVWPSRLFQEVEFADDQVTVRTSGPVLAAQLQLLMSHPLESDRDFSVKLKRRPSGNYTATLPRPIRPRWHWTIEPPPPGGWRLDGTVREADIGHVNNGSPIPP